MIEINKSNNFQESFEQFGGLGQSSGPFQFSNLLQLLNKSKIPRFHFFEKVNKAHLKMVNINY